VRENVTIFYRGARYEIGRGQGFYGIWAAGSAQPHPFEWWHDTPEGWYGAWARFSSIEAPGSITQVQQRSQPTGALTVRSIIAACLVAAGVVFSLGGLFPSYVGDSSLASDGANLTPHVIYLAAWSLSAVLILLGGVRQQVGALLGAGTSVVAFGLFLADLGTVIAGGSHLIGGGLVLSLVGWLAATAGTVLAVRLAPGDRPVLPRALAPGQVMALAAAVLAAAGAAAAFAPAWDSYTLRAANGAAQTITAGNAFSNPGPVIAGDVIVMIALVAVVVIAALWRPVRMGAALLAGAIIPMAAQAISAVVQIAEGTSPALFGIPPAQATREGLTISSGLTPAFWIYLVFVLALIGLCAWMLVPRRRRTTTPAPAPASTFT
jgi:hypothetical protein